MSNEQYAHIFTDSSFWSKIAKVAKKVGREIIYNALLLYYAFPNAPLKYRAVIAGALGYFISPIDLIPDVTPVVGYTDDAAVLIASVAVVASCIDKEVKAKANQKLKDWFD